MSIILDIADTMQSFDRQAAERICAAAAGGAGETFAICLSGGETPRPIYALLADEPYRARMPWARIHWFFGDERHVPHNDARSNFKMVEEALFSRAPIPAQEYSRHSHGSHARRIGQPLCTGVAVVLWGIRTFYRPSVVRPDAARPGAGWTYGVLVPRRCGARTKCKNGYCRFRLRPQPEPEITLTVPVLESSRAVLFLVVGAEKRDALQRLRAGDTTAPAARLHPPGAIHVLTDASRGRPGANIKFLRPVR